MNTLSVLYALVGAWLISSCYGLSSEELTEIHRAVRQASGGPARGSCPHLLKLFHGRRTSEEQEKDRKSNERITSAQRLKREGKTPGEIAQALDRCPTVTLRCDSNARYRSADGRCNNLGNPALGQAGRAQVRLVNASYDDGLSDPRSRSVTGATLPHVRTVSNVVHAAAGRQRRSQTLTLQAFQMGQFLDHDIIATPVQSVVDDCCSEEGRADLTNCDSIIIGAADSGFREGYCMPFPRSAPVFCSEESTQREQKNAVTSFIDASNVYGSSLAEQEALRDGAFLRTAAGNRLPDNPDNEACLSDPDSGFFCSLAGDFRVNVVPSLTTYHTMFVREHNTIATALKDTFSDTETVFQETKKIVTAIMQKIVYDEFLPSFLSNTAMEKYGLRSSASFSYDSDLDPTIINGFGIAFRVGHTWIPRAMEIFSRNRQRVQRVPTENTFLRPDLTYRPDNPPPPGLEGLAYWLSGDPSPETDRMIEDAARNRLFIDSNGDALDLAALNIQRGRDHGLPAYNSYREFCSLPSVPVEWSQLNGGNLADHDSDTTRRLRDLYQSPLDIDLFTGVLTETAVPGGEVGPTLDCILGEQFRRLKYGDRFWYQGEAAGFTSEQLNEINSMSLSRVLCDNFNFGQIHRNAFLSRDLEDCSSLPRMDMTMFGANSQPTTQSPRTRPPGGGGGEQRPPPGGGGGGGGGGRPGGRPGGGRG